MFYCVSKWLINLFKYINRTQISLILVVIIIIIDINCLFIVRALFSEFRIIIIELFQIILFENIWSTYDFERPIPIILQMLLGNTLLLLLFIN